MIVESSHAPIPKFQTQQAVRLKNPQPSIIIKRRRFISRRYLEADNTWSYLCVDQYGATLDTWAEEELELAPPRKLKEIRVPIPDGTYGTGENAIRMTGCTSVSYEDVETGEKVIFLDADDEILQPKN